MPNNAFMIVPRMVHTMDRLSKEREFARKPNNVVAGMAVSSLLGATAALAIAGDLNANGMKKSLSVLNAVQSKWVSSF